MSAAPKGKVRIFPFRDEPPIFICETRLFAAVAARKSLREAAARKRLGVADIELLHPFRIVLQRKAAHKGQ